MKKDEVACFLSLVYILIEVATLVSSQNTIRCRLCNRASTLSDCNKLVTCDKTLEDCYMDELLTDQLTIVYVGGCRAKNVCARAGRKRNDLVTCSRCCSFEEDCNKRLCGIKDDTLHGFQCYSCDHRTSDQSEVKDPRACVTLDTCQPNEVCYSTEADVGGQDSFFYGCLSKTHCRLLMEIAFNDYKNCVSNITALPPGPLRDATCGKLSGTRATSLCHSCCADAGCNYGKCEEQNERMFQLALQGKFDMNTLKQSSLVYILLLCVPTATIAASLGDPCMSDSDCSNLENSECIRIFDCITGSCTCKSGYGNETGTGCNKILSGYNEPCGTGYYCNGANQACDVTSGLCKCTTWYDYHTTAKECVLRTYKILQESCGGQYNLQCLPSLLDSGGQCDGSCGCQLGYVADTSESRTICRAPRYGEACQWLPACVISFNTKTISDDTSNDVPTCRNNICTCPPSHDHKYVNGHHLCLNKVDDGFQRYQIGENCTHFSECESYLCVKCPGVSSGICMKDSGGYIPELLPSYIPRSISGIIVSALIMIPQIIIGAGY